MQSVKNNPAQFHKLELLCKKTLQYWIQTDHIGGMDNADQEQEGRIIIWKCAQSYEGRNFARFSSMVKHALLNKSSNLRAYHTADKRRINKLAVASGITDNTEESYFAHQIAEASYTAWILAQNNGVNNPFDSLSLYDLFELCPNRSYNFFAVNSKDIGWTDKREVTSDNFPYENEFSIVVEKIDNKKNISLQKITEKQDDDIPF